ncbi:hypothetical protein [Kitasatospora sp. NPDC093102]|uniref:hypothetical protein n=1 Tax=Kitasatospora sp. NPDC093102 TaxID=3155069 RepID=UPI00343374C9
MPRRPRRVLIVVIPRSCPGRPGRVTSPPRPGRPTGTRWAQAVLSAPEEEVAAFLSDSFRLVPAGAESEHLDVDAALARPLAED